MEEISMRFTKDIEGVKLKSQMAIIWRVQLNHYYR